MLSERPISPAMTPRRNAVLPLMRKTLSAMKVRTRSPQAASPPPRCLSLRRILLDRLGMTETATIRLSTTEQETAMAMSRKSWPASSSTKTIGRKMATVVRVLARSAPQTSEAPSRAARTRLFPICWWRKMFSSATMALSMTMPTAKLIPARLMTLMLRPSSHMARKVPTIEIGMAVPMMATELKLRRKRKSTVTASAPPTRMLERTRPTALSM